ncbi:MAG: glycoside hydrolase family protein [Carboxylicivirga sp.]|nr:glycoside hydrolase family protein [Carboxylicivirga sp.]
MISKCKTILVLGLSILALYACTSTSQKKTNDNSECCSATTDTKKQWSNTILSRIGEAPVGGGLDMDGYWIWGSSVIKGEDGLYHMFASRWPDYIPFHPGWMVASEIVHATSATPEGPYQFKDVALGRRGIQYWDGKSVHNPKIVKYKDKYLLYYMGSTNPFPEITPDNAEQLTHESRWSVSGRWNKRIGVAVADNLNGPWKHSEQPILEVKPNTFYSYLTSNPSPLVKEDGSIILMFKGRGYNDDGTPSPWAVGLATAPSYEGPYTAVSDEPIFSKEKFGVVEDPHLWKDDDGYHMVVKDMNGTITGEYHAGVLAHSVDGIKWELDKEPKAYSRTVRWNNGEVVKQGQLERAFVFVENGKPSHLFFAAMDGKGGFHNGKKTWNMVIPLK